MDYKQVWAVERLNAEPGLDVGRGRVGVVGALLCRDRLENEGRLRVSGDALGQRMYSETVDWATVGKTRNKKPERETAKERLADLAIALCAKRGKRRRDDQDRDLGELVWQGRGKTSAERAANDGRGPICGPVHQARGGASECGMGNQAEKGSLRVWAFWARASATQPKPKTQKTGKNKAGPRFAISLDQMVISEARLPAEIRTVPNSQASLASDAVSGSSPASEAESQRADCCRRPQWNHRLQTTTSHARATRDRHSSPLRRRMDGYAPISNPAGGRTSRQNCTEWAQMRTAVPGRARKSRPGTQ